MKENNTSINTDTTETITCTPITALNILTEMLYRLYTESVANNGHSGRAA